MSNIALIGVMGCGKTEAGVLLSEKLGTELIEIDIKIEEKMNTTIKNIFAEYGEPFFRDLECKMIKKAALHNNAVVATGGGAVLNDEAMTALKKNSTIVFIERDLDEIVRTVDTTNRPLLKNGPEALYEIYAKRENLYRKYADITVINDCTLDELTDKIIEACIKEKQNESTDNKRAQYKYVGYERA